jgi:putative ABC transport system permease protein
MKDLKLSFFLAIKSLTRSNKSSLVLVVVIMMIVFLNLLFTDSIFSGITKGITDGKINYQYGEVIIEPEDGDKFILDTRRIIDTLENISAVKSIESFVEIPASFINNKRGDGKDYEQISSTLINLNIENDNGHVFDIESNIIDGRYLKKYDYGKIIIGSGLAGGYDGSMFTDDLGGVRPGDIISIDIYGSMRDYEIIGIFKTKNSNLDKKGVILDAEMDMILGTNDESSMIITRLYNRSSSKAIIDILKSSGFQKYKISDWREKTSAGAGIEQSFEMIGSILRIIGSLVAGLVIFIIIFVDIVNKRRQIGILKAIGIKESIVINSYIMRGVFYTIVGSILGYLLMRFIIIETFVRYPIDLPMGDIVPILKDKALISSVLFFVFAGLVGSAIPAMKEIKKRILDLLYH